MFTKLLSTFGIGSAKVDTKLEHSAYMPGDEIRGEAFVVGGSLAQEVTDIYIKVNTFYLKKIPHRHRKSYYHYKKYKKVNLTLAKYKIAPTFKIEAKETRSFPFTIKLPIDTPLSLFDQPIWIQTGLNIDYALDPKDNDTIDVTPLPIMQNVFTALQTLGFSLNSAKCEHNYSLSGKYPFVQEIEFKVTNSSQYKGKAYNIGVYFWINAVDNIEVILEVAKNESGLVGILKTAFNLNEHKTHFQATATDLEQPPEYWTNLLTDTINKALI